MTADKALKLAAEAAAENAQATDQTILAERATITKR